MCHITFFRCTSVYGLISKVDQLCHKWSSDFKYQGSHITSQWMCLDSHTIETKLKQREELFSSGYSPKFVLSPSPGKCTWFYPRKLVINCHQQHWPGKDWLNFCQCLWCVPFITFVGCLQGLYSRVLRINIYHWTIQRYNKIRKKYIYAHIQMLFS